MSRFFKTQDWHHTYPKRWRGIGNTEVKLVDSEEHKAWHILCTNMHPYEAWKRIHAISFRSDVKSELCGMEERAFGILKRNRTNEECYKHCVASFLPSDLIRELNLLGG